MRIELARAGAHVAEVRGGRFAIAPLDLDSAAVKSIRKGIPEAIYESRTRTLALRVPEESDQRLAAVVALTAALAGTRDEVPVATAVPAATPEP